MSRCDLYQQKALKLDIYRQPIDLMLPDKNNKYRTFQGAMLSFLTLLIVLSFFAYKLVALITFQDYQIQVHDLEEYFTSTKLFSLEDGFILAGGVTAFDGSSTAIQDLSIGSVKIYAKNWSGSEEGDTGMFQELDSRFCLPEDFSKDS